MRHAALLEALRALDLSIPAGLFEALNDVEAEAIIAEAGRRHARADLDRLDAAIRTLIDVRYDDDHTRSSARKALDALLNLKDGLGDPTDPDADGELSPDPEDEAVAKRQSKKAAKAAKAAEQKGDNEDGEGRASSSPRPSSSASKSEGPDSGLSGNREITLRIAAADDDDSTLAERDFSTKQRQKLADKGQAMPDGSYPIANGGDLDNAIQSYGRASDPEAVKRHIIKRARALGLTDRLPEGWAVAEARIPIHDAALVAEATTPEGSTWDVLLIQPGTSRNRRQYRREVLQEAVSRGAFEGARAFAPEGPDHFGFGAYGRKRGPKELVGWWTDPRYDESVTLPDGRKAEGVVGTFHVSEAAPWLKTMLADAWSRGKPDLLGWSIVGDGDIKVVRGTDGRPLVDVQRMDVVESIDPVVNPAAGGRTLRLVASKEGAVDWQRLTLAEAIKGLAAGSIIPDDLKEHRPDLLRLVENFEEPPAGPAAGDEAKKIVEAEIGKFRIVQMLEAKLGQRPRLAEQIKARIRERVTQALTGTTLAEADVDTIIKAEVDYVAAFSPAPSAGVGGPVISDMKSERDQMVEAAYMGLGGKIEGRAAEPFSIAKFYVDLTGDSNFTGKYAEGGRLTESQHFAESITSSTFGEIMGDSVTRRMLDYYNLPGLDSWRQVCNVGSAKDFRTNRRIRYGGYGNLPAVAQGDPYTALSSPTDEEATYSVSKRGGTEDMTLEAIANDDLGALRDIPRRLGRAASQTLHEFVFDFMRTNGTIYDSSALAVAGHNNYGTTALDATTLAAARLAMLKQADMSNSKRLGIQPRYLIVPVDLEKTAYELTATDREVNSANNTLNFIRTFNLSVIVVAYWSDTNNWWLEADPNQVPTIEIAFLNGREEPELFVQDQPTLGNVFTNDKITYKIRHIYGGAVMDFRGFYGAIVA